jgi:peptidoglycan hydrolase-like protein with peptidoglycan-binding domain
MRRLFCVAALSIWASAGMAQQTEQSWVQLESFSTLQDTTQNAQKYLENGEVHAFDVGGGWYSIALGPFTPEEARTQLTNLRRQGLIPRDAFVTDGRGFQQQVWPVQAQFTPAAPVVDLTDQAAVADAVEDTLPGDAPTPVMVAEPEPVETLAEARRATNALSRDEKREIQRALAWDGHYTSTIDGLFGGGTARAIAAYQETMGLEPTGTLLTVDREKLLADYRAPFEAFGLAQITDEEAGIEMLAPIPHVKFARYEPPFAHYDSISDRGLRLLLISQKGTDNTLFGLYEIMQTLEIVPLEGERSKGRRDFTLMGKNDTLQSYTYVRRDGEQIKGFTLIARPDEDARVLNVILERMKDSLQSTGDSTLDPSLGSEEAAQNIDLVSGLNVRRPVRSSSGFFVNTQGDVVTTAAAVQGCGTVTLNETLEADVNATLGDTGLAVLRAKQPVAPISVAEFAPALPAFQETVTVAGYSFEGALGAPSVTFGQLADFEGLEGQENQLRLNANTKTGDAGGPVLNSVGALAGALLPAPQGARVLPEGTSLALDGQALKAALDQAGVASLTSSKSTVLAPEDLLRLAPEFTVLVSCWE